MVKSNTLGAICILALTAGLSLPAHADIVMVPASSIQGDNVLFNDGTQTGTTVLGHTQSGTIVEFSGTTFGGGTTITANGGQARIEGTAEARLTSLNWHLVGGGTFNDLEFNINTVLNGRNGGGATSVNFTLYDDNLDPFAFNSYSLANGSNFFGFQGINGQSISSIYMTFIGGNGVQDVRQIRLEEVTAAVPEPSTWAMMILGFAGVGFMVYRRRGQGQALRRA
ncbi:PEPxxWA-CTERM sorting domain-containing protein [Bradyrhizobium lablabi]|nr:PEPxxWA-CTERM sorting domain-containing protein [Bradyrhizobium lablabi]